MLNVSPSSSEDASSAAHTKRRGRIRRYVVWVALIVAGLETYQLGTDSTSVTSSLAQIIFTDNLHEVLPGRMYRSAEMTNERLAATVQRLRIKTVLDLRLTPKPLSKSDVSPEYMLLEKLGVRYVHLPLKGSEEMDREEAERLLKELDADSEGCRSAFRTDVDHDSKVMSISIPN